MTPITRMKMADVLQYSLSRQAFTFQVYRVQGGKMDKKSKKRDFFFSENTVKSAKELVAVKQQQSQSLGRVTLENVREQIFDLKKEQNNIKTKLTSLEDKLKLVLEIMMSRQPTVDRH